MQEHNLWTKINECVKKIINAMGFILFSLLFFLQHYYTILYWAHRQRFHQKSSDSIDCRKKKSISQTCAYTQFIIPFSFAVFIWCECSPFNLINSAKLKTTSLCVFRFRLSSACPIHKQIKFSNEFICKEFKYCRAMSNQRIACN